MHVGDEDLNSLRELAKVENAGEHGILAKGLLLVLSRLDEIEESLLDVLED